MFPTAADWGSPGTTVQFPILDSSSPELQAIVERYNQHSAVLEQCYDSEGLPLLEVPEAVQGSYFER